MCVCVWGGVHTSPNSPQLIFADLINVKIPSTLLNNNSHHLLNAYHMPDTNFIYVISFTHL